MKQSLPVASERQPARQSERAIRDSLPANPFVNNRTEAITQRKLANAIYASPRQIIQRKIAEAIHNSPYRVVQRAERAVGRVSSKQGGTPSAAVKRIAADINPAEKGRKYYLIPSRGEQRYAPVNPPLQAMRFSRFFSFMYYSEAERKLVEKEKTVREFYVAMKKYAVRFPEIGQMGDSLDNIKDATYAEDKYEEVEKKLNRIQYKLDDVSTKIASVGMRGGDELMEPFGINTGGSKTVRIIQIILDTISMLPLVFNSEDNRKTIKVAIHPDIENSGVGLKNDWLGERDVDFAEFRHNQILENLFSLEKRIRGEWKDLQKKFKLEGDLAHIELTGSDLHKSGQQVVIIESAGGQKVVYKPRSVAPDVALLDVNTGIFAALNEKGAELPTMVFHESKDVGAYVEFVHHHAVKTVPEIRKHYRQLGQLVVASQLFGVNDLHYENIMAAGRGPTIIDAETSFLLNVMTTRDFQSSELQLGVFKHVSDIDYKLSNNAFHTSVEKDEWDNRGSDEKRGWDEFIGDKRDADVKSGGPYEMNLKEGIGELLAIIKKNRKLILQLVTRQINILSDVRVVPIATTKFKQNMGFYRDYARYNDETGETGMKNTITLCGDDIYDSLVKKGYRPHDKKIIYRGIKEDFDRGDIPVLHYSGNTKKLIWNSRVVGKYGDTKDKKKVVNQNIKWILQQTDQQILTALQKV